MGKSFQLCPKYTRKLHSEKTKMVYETKAKDCLFFYLREGGKERVLACIKEFSWFLSVCQLESLESLDCLYA